MSNAEYLRQQAKELRAMARGNPDPELARALEALADRCDKLAKEMGTNGHARDKDTP